MSTLFLLSKALEDADGYSGSLPTPERVGKIETKEVVERLHRLATKIGRQRARRDSCPVMGPTSRQRARRDHLATKAVRKAAKRRRNITVNRNNDTFSYDWTSDTASPGVILLLTLFDKRAAETAYEKKAERRRLRKNAASEAAAETEATRLAETRQRVLGTLIGMGAGEGVLEDSLTLAETSLRDETLRGERFTSRAEVRPGIDANAATRQHFASVDAKEEKEATWVAREAAREAARKAARGRQVVAIAETLSVVREVLREKGEDLAIQVKNLLSGILQEARKAWRNVKERARLAQIALEAIMASKDLLLPEGG